MVVMQDGGKMLSRIVALCKLKLQKAPHTPASVAEPIMWHDCKASTVTYQTFLLHTSPSSLPVTFACSVQKLPHP